MVKLGAHAIRMVEETAASIIGQWPTEQVPFCGHEEDSCIAITAYQASCRGHHGSSHGARPS
jgi:hypothetical protein